MRDFRLLFPETGEVCARLKMDRKEESWTDKREQDRVRLRAVSNARLLPLRHTGSDDVQRTALKADVGIARSLLDSRDGLVAGGLRFRPHSHNDNWRRACWPLLVLLYALVLQALSEAA